MNCIKCGRMVPEGEVFCTVCRMPVVTVTEVAPKKKKPSKKKKTRSPAVARKTIRRLALALTVVTLLLLAGVFYIVQGQDALQKRKNTLRVREANVTLREKEADHRDARIDELEKELDKAKKTIRSQQTALDAGDSTGDGAVERSLLRVENRQLLASVKTLEEQIFNLRKEKVAVELHAMELRSAEAFLRQYVVLVPNDGSGLYHRYGCERFDGGSFWVYSPRLALEAGFRPCPECK